MIPPIIDLHCHPTLKIYLCNHKIYEAHEPSTPGLPLGMDVDLPGMEAGKVQVAFCSHYVPEAGLTTLRRSRRFFRLLQWLGLRIAKKFERTDNNLDAWKKMRKSMKKLNDQIDTAIGTGLNVVVAKNKQAFDTAFSDGKTIIIHAAEGSHQLGRGRATAQEYIEQLTALKQQGLALLTIGHFFPNDLCGTGGGIPPKIAKLIGYDVTKLDQSGLSNIGREVVDWCLDNGIIIDLVHTPEKGRWDVYRLLCDRADAGKPKRPVIFSHSGVREIAEKNMQNEADKLYLPDVKELLEIKACGGVLGLILYEYWIAGVEQKFVHEEKARTAEEIEALELQRIDYFIETIQFIGARLGSYENIAIGTDMDGFTRVPDEIRHIRFIGNLRKAIADKISPEAAEMICYKNALRVINEAWL